MRPNLLAVLCAACITATPALAAEDHCLSRGTIEPIPGEPDKMLLKTPTRTAIVSRPPKPMAGQPAVVYRVMASLFNADNNTSTMFDTVEITTGDVVRWQWEAGFHSVTSGTDSSDPEAGLEFDYFVDQSAPVLDRAFNTPGIYNFFCSYHEFSMQGTIVVTNPVGVGDRVASTLRFSRPPTPNPTRGPVAFAIALPAEQRVDLSVLDVNGRRIATIASGTLAGGEHPFRWDGRTAAGAAAPAGRYTLRLRAGNREATAPFALIR